MSKKNQKNERVSFEEYYKLQQELEETKRQYGIEDEPKKEGRISHAISSFFEWRESREKHLLRKKTYILLAAFTGILGGHRFYARQYILGTLYVLLCWTGFSIAMTVIDFLVVIPMQPDENGNILL